MTEPATFSAMLELVPAHLGKVGQLYDAVYLGRVLCTSRTPFYSAARALLREGMPPATVIEAHHRGDPVIAMRSTVGEAARWTIAEDETRGTQRALWRPFPDRIVFGRKREPAGEVPTGDTTTPENG